MEVVVVGGRRCAKEVSDKVRRREVRGEGGLCMITRQVSCVL